MSEDLEPRKPPLLLRFLARAGVAVIGIAILLAVGYVGGWPFFVLVAGLSVVALSEYYSALQTRGIRPNVSLGWLSAVMILFVTQMSISVHQLSRGRSPDVLTGVSVEAEADVLQLVMFVLLFTVAGTLMAQFSNREDESAIANTSTTVFGVVYIGILFTFVLRMRYMDVPSITGYDDAPEFTRRMGGLLFAAVPIWMLDTSAYLAGNLIGRRKLAPKVSPNKTLEGSVAGFLMAVLGTVLLGWWLRVPVAHCLLIGVVVGVMGQLGDLGKSVLKRDVGVKDFGGVFGPHGGVIDRFDAVLFCMPLVYWYFWFVLMRSAG